MKTTVILGCLLMAFMGFWSCDDSDTPPVIIVSEPTLKTGTVEAEGSMKKVSDLVVSDNGLITRQVSYEGQGECELMGTFSIETHHTEIYNEDTGKTCVENGTFTIVTENGDVLFGLYSGAGCVVAHGVQLESQYQVMGGTGEFCQASGEMICCVNCWEMFDNFNLLGYIQCEDLE